MVVMAIIAILATAGLSAYTGYIKKARDTTRIADLAAINTIILASMTTDGLPPIEDDILEVISNANNGQIISDPLNPWISASPSVCLSPTNVADYACMYRYGTCDEGLGYILLAQFESPSNFSRYAENGSGKESGADIPEWYDIGSCSYLQDWNVITF